MIQPSIFSYLVCELIAWSYFLIINCLQNRSHEVNANSRTRDQFYQCSFFLVFLGKVSYYYGILTSNFLLCTMYNKKARLSALLCLYVNDGSIFIFIKKEIIFTRIIGPDIFYAFIYFSFVFNFL